MSVVNEIVLPLKITESAIKEIKNLRANEPAEKKGLRIGVKGGGCSGFTYIIEFDTQKESDSLFNYMDVDIYIDKAQAIYLEGSELDFSMGLDNRGFIFNNPNATETCGCGTSFSA